MSTPPARADAAACADRDRPETPAPNALCQECEAHLNENRDAMLYAAASVGIEHGLSTIEALRSYYRDFHKTDHKPRAAA